VWAAAVVCCGLVASAGAQEKADLPQAPVPNIAKFPGGVVLERPTPGALPLSLDDAIARGEKHNLQQLKQMRLLDGKQLNIVELPMPDELVYEDQRLPCSYANFYIANESVIVPTFRCDRDEKALQIISDCFPGRRGVGSDSTEIIWGLGSFHCLSQQEPAT